MVDLITEGPRPGECLVSEANGARSREQVTLKSGFVYKANAVLGLIAAVTLAAAGAAVAGNTGAATISATPAVAAGTAPGIYKLTAVSAGATAIFMMEDPEGVTLGEATTGTPATIGGIGPFTITDAGADPAVGDQFTITVTATETADAGKYAPFNPDATNGTAVAKAVLYGGVDATAADKRAVVFARDAEVKTAALEWEAGVDANEQAVAIVQLGLVDIIAR